MTNTKATKATKKPLVDLTVSTSNPKVAALASLGDSDRVNSLQEVKAIGALWEKLSDAHAPNPVFVADSGRAYLPCIYRSGSGLVLKWGEEFLDLPMEGELKGVRYGYTIANTGFSGLHLGFTWEDESNRFVLNLPVKTVDSEDDITSKASVSELEDLVVYVRPVDHSSGATRLDKRNPEMVAKVLGSHPLIGSTVKQGKKGEFVILSFLVGEEKFSTYCPNTLESTFTTGAAVVSPKNPAEIHISQSGTKVNVNVRFNPENLTF